MLFLFQDIEKKPAGVYNPIRKRRFYWQKRRKMARDILTGDGVTRPRCFRNLFVTSSRNSTPAGGEFFKIPPPGFYTEKFNL
jgi:hypothetical protein